MCMGRGGGVEGRGGEGRGGEGRGGEGRGGEGRGGEGGEEKLGGGGGGAGKEEGGERIKSSCSLCKYIQYILVMVSKPEGVYLYYNSQGDSSLRPEV